MPSSPAHCTAFAVIVLDNMTSQHAIGSEERRLVSSAITVTQAEAVRGLSLQVKRSSSSPARRINESYIPPTLSFDKYGLPNHQACQDFNRMYSDVDNLYDPNLRALAGKKPGSHRLGFLHIPKNAGTAVSKVLGHPYTKKPPSVTPANGYNCSDTDEQQGSTCLCSFHHIPPRHIRPKIYSNRPLLCVCRDPVDKILSKYKMDGWATQRSITVDGASEWITARLAAIHTMRGDSFCHVMPQYEFIWDEDGARTCQHVVRFEDNVAQSVNKLLDAYSQSSQQQQRRMKLRGPRVGDGTIRHPLTNLSVLDLPLKVAASVRRFYWRDYCLLGYYQNNPWTAGIAVAEDGLSVNGFKRTSNINSNGVGPAPSVGTTQTGGALFQSNSASVVAFDTKNHVVVLLLIIIPLVLLSSWVIIRCGKRHGKGTRSSSRM